MTRISIKVNRINESCAYTSSYDKNDLNNVFSWNLFTYDMTKQLSSFIFLLLPGKPREK